MVSFKPLYIYPRKRPPVPLGSVAEWLPELAWRLRRRLLEEQPNKSSVWSNLVCTTKLLHTQMGDRSTLEPLDVRRVCSVSGIITGTKNWRSQTENCPSSTNLPQIPYGPLPSYLEDWTRALLATQLNLKVFWRGGSFQLVIAGDRMVCQPGQWPSWLTFISPPFPSPVMKIPE
jgi:hypothetical protein